MQVRKHATQMKYRGKNHYFDSTFQREMQTAANSLAVNLNIFYKAE